MPKKFGYDKRKCYFSSLILTEQMKRDEAIRILEEDPYPESEALADMQYIEKQLGLAEGELELIMKEEGKTYQDYKSSRTLIRMAIRIAKALGIEKRNFR